MCNEINPQISVTKMWDLEHRNRLLSDGIVAQEKRIKELEKALKDWNDSESDTVLISNHRYNDLLYIEARFKLLFDHPQDLP